MALSEALARYGEAIESYMSVKDDEFEFKRRESEFRVELGNFYKAEQRENQTIIIREATWRIGAGEKIAVWREKRNGALYIPKHYLVYSDDMEF